MWNENLKWFYEEGTPNGFNDGGIAEFTSTKYDGLAREIIQNSLDARNDENEPVKVVFEKISLPVSYFPDIEGYLETVNKCLDFLKDDIGNKSINKLQTIASCLENCKKRESFNVLKISDYNTKGLSGSDQTYGTPWANLVRISGNSNKGNGSQGSFGIGKYAPFVFSNIRSIIYSTKDQDGNVAVQGKSILSGHIANGNTRTPFGYFGKMYKKNIEGKEHDDSSAIFDVDDIPEEFLRKEIGTSLYILCSSSPIGWMNEILSSVVNSFFYAIDKGNLIVEIIENQKKIIVSKDNLEEQINNAILDSSTKELKTTSDYYKLIKNLDKASESSHNFELPNNKIGTMKLVLYTGKDVESKSIAHIRKAGMKIEDYSPKSLLPYVGICITTNDEMNEFLTTCEAPKHDAWSSNNCGLEEQQQIAKKILNELAYWERDMIKQLAPINESEKLDPLGMEEFLASDIEGEIETDSTNVEMINFKPLETKIKKKKNAKQTYAVLNITNGFIEDENGDESIEGPSGNNNGKGGNGTGNGGQPIQGSKGAGNRSTREKVNINNIKTPYMNEHGKYIISFIPETTLKNCELKVRLAGEDVFENLEIEKMFLINDHGKTEVTTFDVNEKEKVMLEVYFKEIDRAALEVSCYVKK